jgi:hypothetical protein
MSNIYGNFVWWQGVVEDKYDPLYLGRCRVRILGYHTDDKTEKNGIPTEHLPWATIMQPTTSAAISGIGTTPTGPVHGTWVIGFFRDGEDAQEPVIMGTIGGKPEDGPDPAKGFNDPDGKYPLNEYVRRYKTLPDGSEDYDETDGERKVDKYGEPDTNRLARGNLTMPLGTENGENATSLAWKRESRQVTVAKALAAETDSSIPNAGDVFYWGDGDHDDVNYYWNEPNPRYGGTSLSDDEFKSKQSSAYPFNHVRQSEAGHVEEWDDTPGAERLHRYHASGTFEEIQADGTRVVKVQGEDYEIACDGKNVLVKGECNITVTGNARILTQGNLTQQVYGDYHLNVGGDMRIKVGKSMVQEILDQRKIKVGKNDDLTVGISQLHTIAKDCIISVGNNYAQAARAGQWSAIAPTVSITGTSGCTVIGIATLDLMGATVGLSSALLTKIASDVHISIASTTKSIVIAAGIIEKCGSIITTAAGLWNRNSNYTQDNSVFAHSCLTGLNFNASGKTITLN